VAPAGAQGGDLVEQARAGHHVGSPARHHGDADEAPQAVGILEGGSGKGPAEFPAGIARAVLTTADESIDLRQTVTVGRERGDTVYLTAADRWGNMVSFIYSVYDYFGSSVSIPGWA